jgi:Ni/Fe-hydrogenase subunit HybB-like protein
LYWASVISLLGFVTNRLNVSVIGFETYAGNHYLPKWTEFSVTMMIIAMGFALFRLAVQYLPIFPKTKVAVELVVREERDRLEAVPAFVEHAGD